MGEHDKAKCPNCENCIRDLRADNARLRAELAAAEAKLARVVEDMRWFADPENYRHPRPESTSPGPNVLVDGLQIASAALAEIGGGEGRG